TQAEECWMRRHGTVVGDQHVSRNEILGASPSHTKSVPSIVQFNVGPRHDQVIDEIAVRLRIGHSRAKDKPRRVIASAAKLPASTETPAAPLHVRHFLEERGHRRPGYRHSLHRLPSGILQGIYRRYSRGLRTPSIPNLRPNTHV